MRKQVIFITGASGEVGHALIERLAADSDNRLADHGSAAAARRVSALWPPTSRPICSMPTSWCGWSANMRSTSSTTWPRCSRRAASSRRRWPIEVNVEGTLTLLKLAAEQSEWRSQPVQFIFPSSIAIYGMPDLESKTHLPACARVRVEPAAHHVRLQQDLLRDAGQLLQQALSPAWPRRQPVTLDFRCGALSRPGQRLYAAFGRHQRLRAGDAARRGQGRTVRLLCARGRAHPLYGHARRGQRAAAPGRRRRVRSSPVWSTTCAASACPRPSFGSG